MKRAWFSCALIFTACVEQEEPDSLLRLAWIELHGGSPVMIDAPDVAVVGADIPVHVTTYRGACTTPERTDIVIAVDTADIVPYDRELLNVGCTLQLIIDPREYVIRFNTPGVKTVRVHGLTAYFRTPTIVELTVDVTP